MFTLHVTVTVLPFPMLRLLIWFYPRWLVTQQGKGVKVVFLAVFPFPCPFLFLQGTKRGLGEEEVG